MSYYLLSASTTREDNVELHIWPGAINLLYNSFSNSAPQLFLANSKPEDCTKYEPTSTYKR